MTSLARMPVTVLLALALLLPAMGTVMADEAAPPTAEADTASTEPVSETTEADAATDCGCGARSPGQLFETQQEVNEATIADPGL